MPKEKKSELKTLYTIRTSFDILRRSNHWRPITTLHQFKTGPTTEAVVRKALKLLLREKKARKIKKQNTQGKSYNQQIHKRNNQMSKQRRFNQNSHSTPMFNIFVDQTNT